MSSTKTFQCLLLVCFVPSVWKLLFHFLFTGLVEFNIFCQLLPHVECRGPRLAVLLHVSGLSLGRWLPAEYERELQLIALPVFDHSLHVFSICCVCSRCLRNVSNQRPCCLCLQYQQWSMSTFWQSALGSSTLYSSAFSCALEVRSHTNSFWMAVQINTQTIITIFVYNSFLLLAVMFNFILHDQRKGPIWNIIMWTSLFLGHGVIICLYSQEWYAQQYCPIKEVTAIECLYRGFQLGFLMWQMSLPFQPSFLELVKPRSWSCKGGPTANWPGTIYDWTFTQNS